MVRREAGIAELDHVRDRLDSWRRTSGTRRRIPEDLWEEVAQLARAHGVHQVARALRLNYERVKRRASSSAGRLQSRKARPAFLELELAQPASNSGCVIELGDPKGARMTIRLPAEAPVDLGALAKAFWSRRR